jgi:hypothetical protein
MTAVNTSVRRRQQATQTRDFKENHRAAGVIQWPMLPAIWIFTLLGLVLWSLAAWGLHAVLTIDPMWVEDVEALIREIPYAAAIDRWFPGWRELLEVLMDVAQLVLGWVGTNAPLVAWIVWGVGTITLLVGGLLLTLIVCLLRDKPTPRPA